MANTSVEAIAPPSPLPTAQPQSSERASRSLRFWARSSPDPDDINNDSDEDEEKERPPQEKWSMGILNDKYTEEVPGTVLLLSAERNEPLGLRHAPAGHSSSSLPSPYPPRSSRPGSTHGGSSIHSQRSYKEKKKTPDGQIVLEPQPDDSLNDPLNWPVWRRDSALLSLGFYCMIGGGMTPILAAGFSNVAATFGVTEQQVSYTTGLYMMGLGLGSVIASPTAVLYGKRPVYLVSGILFILASIWCALAPDYPSLVVARIVQGMAVSPVECLPSATIAEIYFVHDRGFRLGVYTLLLLSGKNLVPLVSAVIIQTLSWRWLFWIVAMVVAFALALLFAFVPETFWDRTPRPKIKHKRPTGHRTLSNLLHHQKKHGEEHDEKSGIVEGGVLGRSKRHDPSIHAHFAQSETNSCGEDETPQCLNETGIAEAATRYEELPPTAESVIPSAAETTSNTASHDLEKGTSDASTPSKTRLSPASRYTEQLRGLPPQSFAQTLKPWNGRITHVSWLRVAIRPFVLYAYPSILWSALVYSLSIGWLIVISESVSVIYRSADTYNFSALGAGLVYISPFIGGVLGTAVAGRVSDILVRYLARRNGGVYEPEFRLIMAGPVAISTAVGLMGYGWSAQERDRWIVPTVFFGVISFGCSLGSTTAITFCVDCYRQYAGEALVTLNFSKNIFHGLVFSLFFVDWLDADGSKEVFVVIGVIQLVCLLTAIPMYIYGKRARMRMVRKRLMVRWS